MNLCCKLRVTISLSYRVDKLLVINDYNGLIMVILEA